jgi:hypothetical protein
MTAWQYSRARPAVAQSNLTTVAPYMFWLMFRNVASDGLVFEDPVNAGVLSKPGCVLASPSWENSATQVSQDYVYNWTRDAALVAIELAAGPLPTSRPLIDYVMFAQICQNSGGEERQQPVLELRLIPVRDSRQELHLNRPSPRLPAVGPEHRRADDGMRKGVPADAGRRDTLLERFPVRLAAWHREALTSL